MQCHVSADKMDVWFFDKGADFGTGSPLGELIWGMMMYAMLVSCLLGSSPSPGPPTLPTQRPASVSCHDIAGIWVAFFSRCQRYRSGQVNQMVATWDAQCQYEGQPSGNILQVACSQRGNYL